MPTIMLSICLRPRAETTLPHDIPVAIAQITQARIDAHCLPFPYPGNQAVYSRSCDRMANDLASTAHRGRTRATVWIEARKPAGLKILAFVLDRIVEGAGGPPIFLVTLFVPS